MTSFPHNLDLDSQPCFGLTPSEFFNLHNFLINLQIFMKLVAKRSASVSLSYQVHVKFCNPIPLTIYVRCKVGGNPCSEMFLWCLTFLICSSRVCHYYCNDDNRDSYQDCILKQKFGV